MKSYLFFTYSLLFLGVTLLYACCRLYLLATLNGSVGIFLIVNAYKGYRQENNKYLRRCPYCFKKCIKNEFNFCGQCGNQLKGLENFNRIKEPIDIL